MRRQSSGVFTLLGIGAYYLWRNRESVQNMLNERGIQLPNFLNRFIGSTGVSGRGNVISSGERQGTTGYQPETGTSEDLRRAI